MAGRRALTEGIVLEDDDGEPIDLNGLKEEEMNALAMAYAMEHEQDDDDESDEEDENKQDSDIDNLDFDNFKGIYFDEDPNRKYQDPDTGCHFEYYDLCKRLAKLKDQRKIIDRELGIQDSSSSGEGSEKGIQVIGDPQLVSKSQKKAVSHQREALQQKIVQQQVEIPVEPKEESQPQLSKGSQVITLQRRQIRGLIENSQANQKDQKKDWLSGKNIQNYLNDLKSRLGNQNFRSKSQEKAGNLINEKQNSYRGQMINQLVTNQNALAQLHRKQQSYLQNGQDSNVLPQSIQKDLSKGKLSQISNGDLKKNPSQTKKKKSRGEMSIGSGFNPEDIGQSFDRRTFDPVLEKYSKKREEAAKQMVGSNIYNDNSQHKGTSGSRQFRNSQYSSNSKDQNAEDVYMKNGGQVRHSNQASYCLPNQIKTRNQPTLPVPFHNQSNSINQKLGVNEEIEKMSPYFVRQKSTNSQTNKKAKPYQIVDQFEIKGQNPYSRNTLGQQSKTVYSQQTQELLERVQRNSNLINNIKQGLQTSSGKNSNFVKTNLQQNQAIRKSYGGPVVPSSGNVYGVQNIRDLRPGTQGQVKTGDQNKVFQLGKNDRSRQKGGLIAALPSSQQQKSLSNKKFKGQENKRQIINSYVNKQQFLGHI